LYLPKSEHKLAKPRPFAIETHITRGFDLKVTDVGANILAVGGDGQLIATLSRGNLPGRSMYFRTVWNKRRNLILEVTPCGSLMVLS
jgi:hypothetical protein